jgi:hypothetical protein
MLPASELQHPNYSMRSDAGSVGHGIVACDPTLAASATEYFSNVKASDRVF